MPGITVNGAKLYYEDIGDGKPIVFIHGYVGDIEDWRSQINHFSGKYRCLAIDQRGRGRGVAPKKPGDYSFDLFVNDIYKWLRKLKVDKFVLAGHSLGGKVVQGFTLAYPQMVEALVLTDTSSGAMSGGRDNSKHLERLHEIALTLGTVAAFDYDVVNNPSTRKRYLKHPETFDRMREKYRTTSPEGYVYVNEAARNSPVFSDRLSEIECPCLLICGTDDTAFVEPMKTMVSKIKKSELVWIQEAGHGVMYEKPSDYNRALGSFLGKIRY